MWHYFVYGALQKWKLHTSLCTATVKKMSFLRHKHWNIHLKHDITQMHKKHIAFPFWPALLTEWHHGKGAAGLRGYFHRFHCSCYYSCLPVFGVNDCGSLKGCMVVGGGDFHLTARQSMVKVDVAQVFWRPFWQTHFVVVVDHPPAGRKTTCGKCTCLLHCEMFCVTSLKTDCYEDRANGSIYFSIQSKKIDRPCDFE